MKLKPVEIKNFAFGSVRIVDPSTQAVGNGSSPSPTSNTYVAWHIYGFSKAAEEESSSFCIYLPDSSLMFNNELLPVDPINGNRGGNNLYDIGNTRGDIICSIYRDGFGYKAKIGAGIVPGSVLNFLVCSVGGNAKSLSVTQYASGLITLYSKSAVNALAGPFAPIMEEDSDDSGEERVVGYENCYWMSGGVLRTINDQPSPGNDGFVALREGATPDTMGTASLVIYPTLSDMQVAQQDPAYFIMPLYKIEGGTIALDLRSTPQSQQAEVL